MKNPVMQQPAPPEPYTCPELVVYGNIREITQSHFTLTGHQDNTGQGGQNKTD